METKKKQSEFLSEITDKFKEYTGRLTAEGKGFILLAYDKNEDGTRQNAFMGEGHPTDVAECIYGCITQNETLASVIIAASNALMQNRVLAAQMKSETPIDKKQRTLKN
jgi:hypothetical protein